jgi:hypothetical protein
MSIRVFNVGAGDGRGTSEFPRGGKTLRLSGNDRRPSAHGERDSAAAT